MSVGGGGGKIGLPSLVAALGQRPDTLVLLAECLGLKVGDLRERLPPMPSPKPCDGKLPLEPAVRDLIVEAFAENKEGALRPGMFATVLLLVGEDEVATVPVKAIKTDGTVRRMYVAKDNAAHELVVKTGVQKDGRIAVFEALQTGDAVVLAPPPGLRDGTPLQLQQ